MITATMTKHAQHDHGHEHCMRRPWPCTTPRAFGHFQRFASIYARGVLGAFGHLKQIASLQDPCLESFNIIVLIESRPLGGMHSGAKRFV